MSHKLDSGTWGGNEQRTFYSKPLSKIMKNKIESDLIRKLIDKLRGFGADHYVQLPQIAVMGDTSSGKSSVLSALSGINFPSASNLTTRCATELILSYSPVFSGSVSIRSFEKQSLEQKQVSLNSIEDVTGVISEMTRILVKDLGNSGISQDSIVINLCGPELPNLTLIDLPGYVRAVGNTEDSDIIGKIKSLVGRYLKQERTVILAVVPANVDMHNSEILQAATEADPEGHRTISVITKLDLVDQGSEGQVIDLLLNRTKTLKLGYHAVVCRGQKDLSQGVTIASGLAKEKLFFETKEPWNTVDKSIVGINNLRANLSLVLEGLIKKSLPNVEKDILEEQKKTKSMLEGLGQSIETETEMNQAFISIVGKINFIVNAALEGNYSDSFFDISCESDNEELHFGNRLRAVIEFLGSKFKDEVSKITTYSPFDIRPESDLVLINDKKTKVTYLNDQYVYASSATVSILSSKSSHPKNDTLYDVSLIDKSNAPCSNEVVKGYFYNDQMRPVYRHGSTVADMSQIISKLKLSKNKSLPIVPNYNVFCDLVKERISLWTESVDKYVEKVIDKFKSFSLQLSIYCASARPVVQQFIYRKLTEVIENLQVTVAKMVKDVINIERSFPSTRNHYLTDILIKYRSEPLKKALSAIANEDGMFHKNAVFKVLESYGVGQVSNEYQEAIETQINVAAYVKVAQKRFIDEIIMIFELKFIEAFQSSVKDILELPSKQVLESLFKEGHLESEKRKALIRKKKVIDQSVKCLANYLNFNVVVDDE